MDLSQQIESKRHLGTSICQRLREEINKLGFADAEVKHYPNYDDACFLLIKDPYTGQHNLTGQWYDEINRQTIGKLQFNSDGSFYAEYDVVRAYPGKINWFIEGVTAWGSVGNIKSEAKLLPMPS